MTWRSELAERFKAVRLAIAPTGEPLPQVEFAALLERTAAALFGHDVEHRYGQSLVNRIEKGGQSPTLQDVAVYAAVDPLRRGKLWLAWNEASDASARHETLEEVSARTGIGVAKRKPFPQPEREKATRAGGQKGKRNR